MTIRHTPLMLLLDGYKIDHRRQYPIHTEFVYTNGTYRSSRILGQNEVVNFGPQGFCQKFFEEYAEATFFNRPKDAVLAEYAEFLNNYLGPNDIGVDHIAALHDLGYLPLEVCSLPEGTLVPLRIPAFTIENTHPEFFWLTNYFETLMSNQIWLASTSATTAYRYRRLIQAMTDLQGADCAFVNWQGHDFSMRGMGGIDAAELSGAGHLLSFTGTDTVPAIEYVNRYYPGNGFVGGSVAATEHSVMCAGGKESERETFLRILNLYRQGIVSIVSDTWDFWGVIEHLLPSIKAEILGHDRKTVIRPDCYDEETEILTPLGWVKFQDLPEGIHVAQVNDDETFSFVKPLKIVDEYYEGDMIHFYDGKNKLDLVVTPNHRMVFKQNDQLKVQFAQDAAVGIWGKDILRSVPYADSPPSHLTPEERLAIAFQADGSYQTGVHSRVRFSFAKQRKIDRLKSILDDCGISYKIYSLAKNPKYPHHSDRVEFSIEYEAEKLSKDFHWISDTPNAAWARAALEEISYWDATRRSHSRFKIDTTNVSVADKIEVLCLYAGYGCKRSVTQDRRDDKFSDVHTLHVMKSNLLGGQSIHKEVVSYSGRIGCVQVPSGRVIVRRFGAVCVSGNSGDPVNIICGDPHAPVGSVQFKGVVEALWDIFGGVETAQGYRVLDSHIGVIYGDSITEERCRAILERLSAKGFAAANVVFGIGSYTYQYVTRDTYGFAMKATWVQIDGEEHLIQKSPKTDSGVKNSALGRIIVQRDSQSGKLVMIDGLTKKEQAEHDSLLRPIWRDGEALVYESFDEIRHRLHPDVF